MTALGAKVDVGFVDHHNAVEIIQYRIDISQRVARRVVWRTDEDEFYRDVYKRQRLASSTASPASRIPAKFTPFTVRPSLTSRQGIILFGIVCCFCLLFLFVVVMFRYVFDMLQSSMNAASSFSVIFPS